MLRLRRAVALALVWSPYAAAEQEVAAPSEGLAVRSTDACLTPASTVAAIEHFRPRRSGDRRLRIDLLSHGTSLVAEIYRDSEPLGERPFPDLPRDCFERRRLVGIALAMALERLAPSEAETTGDVLPPAEAPRVDERAAPPSAPAVKRDARRPGRQDRREGPPPAHPNVFTAAVQGEASVGVLPTVGFGAGLSFGHRRRRWSIDLGASVERGLPYGLGVGVVDTTLLVASVRGCGALIDRSPLRIAGCAGFVLGRWSAAGRGYDRDAEAVAFFGAAAAGARVDVALFGALGLRFEADVIVPLGRPRIDIRDQARTLRAETSPIGVTLAAGPTVSF